MNDAADSVMSADEVARALESLDSEFEKFSDAQFRHFRNELVMRAYLRGAPPQWIDEERYPPEWVLHAVRSTIAATERGEFCQ